MRIVCFNIRYFDVYLFGNNVLRFQSDILSNEYMDVWNECSAISFVLDVFSLSPFVRCIDSWTATFSTLLYSTLHHGRAMEETLNAIIQAPITTVLVSNDQ
eukprot:941522_1